MICKKISRSRKVSGLFDKGKKRSWRARWLLSLHNQYVSAWTARYNLHSLRKTAGWDEERPGFRWVSVNVKYSNLILHCLMCIAMYMEHTIPYLVRTTPCFSFLKRWGATYALRDASVPQNGRRCGLCEKFVAINAPILTPTPPQQNREIRSRVLSVCPKL